MAERPKLNEASVSDELARMDLELKQIELESRRASLEKQKFELAKFNEEKEERLRIMRVRITQIRENEQKKKDLQAGCKHLSGGDGSRTGRAGFFNGDGDKMGAAVNDQQLPTGEIYRLCLRCQKEWHHPEWQVRIEIATTGKTTMTRSQYNKQLKEYIEACSWTNKGKYRCEASLFKIPALDNAIGAGGLDKVAWADESPALSSMV